MRLAHRRLAFLLTFGLLINSTRAEAGIMAQELHDRIDFLHFVGFFFSFYVSDYLKSIVEGKRSSANPSEQELVSLPSQLEELERFWETAQLEFQDAQLMGTYHLILYSRLGDCVRASPEELQKIAEIAPRLAKRIGASFRREVHLRVSTAMLSLLVKLVRGEDLKVAINELDVEDRLKLMWEANKIKCERLVLLLKDIPFFVYADRTQVRLTMSQLHKVAEIAPGLATLIEGISYTHGVHLPVSATMLTLLSKLAKDENTHDSITSLENFERGELIDEAKRIKSKRVVSLLEGNTESDSTSSQTSPRTLPTSSPRANTNNHNGHNVQTQPVDTLTHTRERRHSITTFKRPQLVTKKPRQRSDTMPPVIVTENLIPKDLSLFEQLLHFASTPSANNSLLCHYYPMVISDAELASKLKANAGQRLYHNFANALIKCFAEEGFPNDIPSQELRDRLFPYVPNTTIGEVYKEKLRLALELASIEGGPSPRVKTESKALESVFARYDDRAIAVAWTQSTTEVYRDLKPKDLKYCEDKEAQENSSQLFLGALNNTRVWLLSLIAKAESKEAKLALLMRLVNIANIMLDASDYHGAFVIHLAFQETKTAYPLLQETDKEKAAKRLNRMFSNTDHKFSTYHECRERIKKLRSSEGKTFLSPALFYIEPFTRTKSLAEQMNPYDGIVELGNLLQMIHRDKSKAVQVSGVNPNLVQIFMGLFGEPPPEK